MQLFTKSAFKQDITPVIVGSDWELLLPSTHSEHELSEIQETRDALRNAETVIRGQEERIRLLEKMALTDELTGLSNRRAFVGAFDRELALAQRDTNACGVLVMIDLDGFKQINDRWGHQVGDSYLRTVAQVLQEQVRSSDVVGRLGGDEFALLLTHMDEEDGAARLAKIEQVFHCSAMMAGEEIPLRASFGHATYSGGDRAEDVIQSADNLLYASKARNRQDQALRA